MARTYRIQYTAYSPLSSSELCLRLHCEVARAARAAVDNPLLEASITGATDAVINITGGKSLTLFEAEDAAEVVRDAANTDINIIFGAVINENLNDEVIVTVIATGFDDIEEETNTRYEQRPSEKVPDDFDLPPFLRDRNY